MTLLPIMGLYIVFDGITVSTNLLDAICTMRTPFIEQQ